MLAVAAAMLGCDNGESEVVDVTGTWLDVAADGSAITVTLIQSGLEVSGSFNDEDGWTGTVSGAVSGDAIGFTYTYSDGYLVYSRARVEGDAMLDGVFWSLDGNRCGTWSATRVIDEAPVPDGSGTRRPPAVENGGGGPPPLQVAGTITFDTVFFPGGPVVLSDLTEGDMLFVTANGVTHSDIGIPEFPDNGTPFLLLNAGQAPLVISNALGEAFSMMSVDLSEYSTAFAMPRSVPFVGYRSDGGTVSRTFNLDGVIDGDGPIADFETFSFGNDFRDLSYVEVQTDVYCMDNLVLEE